MNHDFTSQSSGFEYGDRNARLRTLTALLCITAYFSVEHTLPGVFAPLINGDNGEYTVPDLVATRFANGLLPSWDRFSAGGVEFWTGGQVGLVHVLIFRLLPVWLANALCIASQFAAAVFGTYLLASRAFGLHEAPSVVAAFSYAALMMPYLPNATYSYLPLLLWSLEDVLAARTSRAAWLRLLGLVLLVSHTAFFSRLGATALVLVLWGLCSAKVRRASDWTIVLGAGIAVVALRAHEIAILVKTVGESQFALVRAEHLFEESVRSSVGIFSQPAILTACTVLGIIGLTRGDRRSRLARLAAFSALAAFSYPGLVFAKDMFQQLLPAMRTYSYEHTIQLGVPLGLVLLSAGGVQRLLETTADRALRGSPRGLTLRILAGVLVLGFCVISLRQSLVFHVASVYNWTTHGSIKRRFESPVLLRLAGALRDRPPVRVEPFQIHPDYLHAYGLETAGGYAPLFSRRYYELWAAMVAPGLEATYQRAYLESFARRRRQNGGDMRFRGDRLMLYPYANRPEWRLDDLYRMNVLALMNVGYLVSRDRLVAKSLALVSGPARPYSALSHEERMRVNLRENVEGRTHLYVYRNTQALPRVFTVARLRVAGTAKDVIDAVVAADPETLRNVAFVEAAAAERLPKGVRLARRAVDALSYNSDSIGVTLGKGGATILVVLNAYSKTWKSEIDGRPADIFPVNYAFWGVYVPEGARRVTFYHDPL